LKVWKHKVEKIGIVFLLLPVVLANGNARGKHLWCCAQNLRSSRRDSPQDKDSRCSAISPLVVSEGKDIDKGAMSIFIDGQNNRTKRKIIYTFYD
jgi:hypothetical protein